MVETTLPDGLETSGRRCIANFVIFLDVSDFFVFLVIFSVFQKNRVFGYSGPPSYGIGATIRIGRERLCLPYAGFLHLKSTLGY